MKSSPKAKITDKNREESRLLKAIWDSTGHAGLTQAEFGHQFAIGTQAAVGFFLNGKSALSMKAAKGFATGLGCPIGTFSTRLAAEVDAASAVNGPALTRSSDANWPFLTVTPDQYFEVLTQGQRDIVEAMAHTLVNARDAPEKYQTPANNSATSTNAAKAA